MKPQSVDNFILSKTFGRMIKISKPLNSVGIRCKQVGCIKTEKMDKAEVRAVIKDFFKKGISPKKIHNDFIKTLRDVSPSYSTVKKWAAEFRGGRESADYFEWSGRPKEAITDETLALCTVWSRVTGEACVI